MKEKDFEIHRTKWKLIHQPSIPSDDNQFIWGLSDPTDRTITIATKDKSGSPMDKQEMRYTIAHECIHSILDTGFYTKESRNERLVEYLAKGIIELIDQKIIK